MLKPLGGDGAPFKAVGEWLVPVVTVEGREVRKKEVNGQRTQQENHSQVPLPSNPGPLGHFKAAGRLRRGSEPQGGQGLGGPGTPGWTPHPPGDARPLCGGWLGRRASPASEPADASHLKRFRHRTNSVLEGSFLSQAYINATEPYLSTRLPERKCTFGGD